jgi:hypothetical protein
LHLHLDRCKLAANTVKAYKRQTTAYVTWLTEHATDHPDAFVDIVGAEPAVTALAPAPHRWRAKSATVNQALAAVTPMYAQAGPRIAVKSRTRGAQSDVRRDGAGRDIDPGSPRWIRCSWYRIQ